MCRLSHNSEYIAGATTDGLRLQLSKVTEKRLTFMGEFLFQGDIDIYSFSRDDKYITVGLETGEVVIVKILDATNSDMSSEVRKLACFKNHQCKTEDEYKKDFRWTSITAAVGERGEKRGAKTLRRLVEEYVMPEGKQAEWKAGEPVVGSREFEKFMISKNLGDLFDEDREFIPTIINIPLDVQTVDQPPSLATLTRLKSPSLRQPRQPSPLAAKQLETKLSEDMSLEMVQNIGQIHPSIPHSMLAVTT
ncbi:uncharacterized protein [Watersipora subatra]|uniref:uncharacterized protein n=1 Tax=Watersipora subatra TaxID=2589382 RepID=UPI00355B2847